MTDTTEARAARVAGWLSKLWCSWTHGGGQIDRDSQGRINWRCSKCGRWGDDPVPLQHEVTATRKLENPR